MGSSSPGPVSEAAKQLFLRCMDAADEEHREGILADADPAQAEAVRELLASMDHANAAEKIFEIPRAGHNDLAATAESHVGESGAGTPVGFKVAEQPGMRLGNYKLLEPIGEGGMGSVFMAQQTEPVKRKVAIKIVKPGLDSRQVVARFEAERQALALMDHPSIARVFDGGTTDQGRPYFVMELVKGIPLTDFCDRRKLSLRDRLQLFIDLCRGVQHAHQRGIIHRDLKPSNVLVTLHDDKPVVKIIDFGIAKAMNQELTDKTLFTQFAAMVGTPLYMSPEQAELSGLDVDTRSDVYSLGVIFYELLTGTTPFDRSTLDSKGIDEVRRMIRETEPPRPSQRISTVKAPDGETFDVDAAREIKRSQSELRGELDWISMRGLEKDRHRRYQSPNEFADDVQRYLDGDAVEACPPSIMYRTRKGIRRNRVVLTTAGLVVATALIGLVASLNYAARAKELARQAGDSEERALTAAENAKQFASERDQAATELSKQVIRATDAERRQSLQRASAEEALYQSDIVSAFASVERGEDAEALSLLLSHVPAPKQVDRRGWEWYQLLGRLRLAKRAWQALGRRGGGVDWHPDGESIVTGGRSTGGSPLAVIWRAGDLAKLEELPGWGGGPKWDSRGRFLASGVYGNFPMTHSRGVGGLIILDSANGEQQVAFTSTKAFGVLSPLWNQAGTQIAARVHDGAKGVEIWRRENGSWTPTVLPEAKGFCGWNHDDKYFAVIRRQSIELLDGGSLSKVKSVPIQDEATGGVAPWHPSLPLAVFPTKDYFLFIDVELEKEVARLASNGVRWWRWSPDGSHLAMARGNGRLDIYTTSDWTLKESIAAHDGPANGVAWHPSGERLVTLGKDGVGYEWNLEQPIVHFDFQSRTHDLQESFSMRPGKFFWANEEEIVYMGANGHVHRASINGQTRLHRELPAESNSWHLVSPTHAASCEDKESSSQLSIFGLADGEVQMMDIGHRGKQPLTFGYMDARNQLVVASMMPVNREGFLAIPRVFDLKTGDILPIQLDRLWMVCDIATSVNGSTIAVCGGGANKDARPFLNLIDSDSGAIKDCVMVGIADYGNRVEEAAWSSDSERVVLSVTDGECRVYDTSKRITRIRVRPHRGSVNSLARHPLEDLVASGGEDGKVCLWHASSGKTLIHFEVDSPVTQVSWSPDGNALAARAKSGLIRIWDTRLGRDITDSSVVMLKRKQDASEKADRAFSLARAMMREGNSKLAIEILEGELGKFGIDSKTDFATWEKEESLQAIPKNIVGAFHHYKGVLHEQSGDLEQAAVAFGLDFEFSRTDPSTAPAMARLRRAGIEVPSFSEAVAAYRSGNAEYQAQVDQVIKRISGNDTEHGEVLVLRARAYRNLAKFLEACQIQQEEVEQLRDKAAESMAECLEALPDRADLIAESAEVFIEMGRKSEAIVAIKKAIEIDPAKTHYKKMLEDFSK